MLSQKAKYALRALLMLAEAPPEELVLIQDVADRQKVPKKFLELILVELKRHGFAHSQRGRSGGYCLARPADTITFGQVVRAMDGPFAPLPCASITGYRKCADCHRRADLRDPQGDAHRARRHGRDPRPHHPGGCAGRPARRSPAGDGRLGDRFRLNTTKSI